MINVINPFYKLENILNLYRTNPDQLCENMRITKTDLLDLLKGCFELEYQMENYKLKIIKNYSLEEIFNNEKNNVQKTLDAFDLDLSDFKYIELSINPYAEFVNSSYIFTICDGKVINGVKHIGEYCFIPKIIATNELRIDEYPVFGPLKFLCSVKRFGSSFNISQLIEPSKVQDLDLIIRRIKKMLLNQLLIIK